MPGLNVRRELVLTIVFHPDLARIGEFSVLSRRQHSHIVGRNTLEFARGAGAGKPLGDRYVSRLALEIGIRGEKVVLSRSEDSCRCRVAGEEMALEMVLDKGQLEPGVPVLLAHSVVLMLSLSMVPDSGGITDHCGLVGSSAYIQGLQQQVAQAAACDADVLLRGETGTGKEVVATAIHSGSVRSGAPLVSVNVAAIPVSLAPAALFGSAKGAFTGADRATPGYFQQARGGTLFLDEIGDAPGEVQPQLLRALQQREVQAVGGPVQRVDLRVISATDAALDGDLCSFKSALRHRLGAFEIALLPLRDHPGDVGELLVHFLAQAFAEAGRSQLLPSQASNPRLVAAWAGLFYESLRYPWPGNVRQLSNFCNQIAIASRTGLVIPPAVLEAFAQWAAERKTSDTAVTYRAIQDISEEEFDRAMRDSCHEISGVAERLGVTRQAVYRRIASTGAYRLVSQVPIPELQQAVAQCAGDTQAAARLLCVSATGLRSRMHREAGS